MDNTDKMEDWRMLTVGRKSAARSRMRKEKDNVRMTRAKRVEWVKCAERAGEIWAVVTLGRWLGALSSVYITLTDQAKTATRQKWSLVGARCASAGERLRSGSAARAHAFVPPREPSFGYRGARHTVEIHTMRLSQSMRLNSQAQTNCLLFSRGQGLVGLHSTHSGPVFTQQHSTSLGARLGSFYLLPVHAVTLPVQGCRTCSCPLLNNTLIYLNSSVISLSRLLFPEPVAPASL